MRICIDLDGVLCENKLPGRSYCDLKPIPGAIEAIKKLKDEGHYIIIATARNMKTLNNNVGAIIAKQGPIVMDWLKKYDIQYDELFFGKSLYHVVIDDRAIAFSSWDKALEELKTKKEDF